ncbi:MAG: hypothetical protein HOD85_12735 [Deltaproteobacteria bacterium]|nr:hypothetical protein [Deltaproteobacteria bacterium]
MNEDPSLNDMLEAFWDRKVSGLHTAMPGKVESYTKATRLATVKPLIKFQFVDEQSPTEIPNLQDVPVLMPGTASGCIHLPGIVGATGLLVFAENSIEDWIAGAGNAVFPTEGRKFDLSDAFFIPGVYPELMPYLGDIDEDVLDLSVMPGIKMRMGNGAADIVTQLHELADIVSKIIVATGTGPDVAALTVLMAKLAQIKA